MSNLYIVTLLILTYIYIMQNARQGKSQVGIKISRNNINNLRHVDDTTLMAESEEELLSEEPFDESERGE